MAEGARTTTVDAGLHGPLTWAAETLDFSRPIALILNGVTGCVADGREKRYRRSGAVSHRMHGRAFFACGIGGKP